MKLASIAAAALAALAAVTSAHAEDKVSLRLNWYLGGLHVPFYYGKEKGIYAAEGIDLTINEGRGSANTVQVVAAGSDTVAVDTFARYSGPAGVTAVASCDIYEFTGEQVAAITSYAVEVDPESAGSQPPPRS